MILYYITTCNLKFTSSSGECCGFSAQSSHKHRKRLLNITVFHLVVASYIVEDVISYCKWLLVSSVQCRNNYEFPISDSTVIRFQQTVLIDSQSWSLYVYVMLLPVGRDHMIFIERHEGRLTVVASLENLSNKEMYVTLMFNWFSIFVCDICSFVCDVCFETSCRKSFQCRF